MSNKLSWVGEHIEVTPPKKPKKLTGTRFATVLGLSPWKSGFETWCEVTRTYEEPFEDTIYTVAGKTIEPKQAQYMKDTYLMENLVTPEDMWGKDFFKKTYGDFFPNEKVLGGMWDYLLKDENGKTTAVLEMKTTKRAEDWANDIPEYYALQAALYAYLLGVDQVYMVCSLLSPKDYDHPEDFVPSVKNTFIRPFNVSARYPKFERLVKMALDWWETYVTTGISPDYDEKKDADVLKALRTATAPSSTTIKELLVKAESLQQKMEELKQTINPVEKELKEVNSQIRAYLETILKDGDKYATATGSGHTWTLTRSTSLKLDEERLKDDGLYDLYAAPTTSYRLNVSKNKEDK